MAKRIFLNPQGEEALKKLTEQLKDYNPALYRFQNNLVSLALVNLNEDLSETIIKDFSERLLSRLGKKKMLVERVEAIARSLDEESFKTLESSLKKVCSQFEKKDNPPPPDVTKVDAVKALRASK
jgi:hypothetical protein